MRRSVIGACAVVALVGAGPAPGRAGETTLTYQLVVHVTEQHAIPVPDRPGHELGLAAFEGLAIFDDGRIADHWYAGSFDFVDGAGRFRGYATWTFEDGAELHSSYAGEARATDRGITFAGRHSALSGTGAYAGISGEGQFEGTRVDHLERGGDTYQNGTLTLRRPE